MLLAYSKGSDRKIQEHKATSSQPKRN